MASEAAEKALSRAKMKLMLSANRFLAAIALQMEHKFSDAVPTAATNGKQVLYNEDFFMSYSVDEQVGLIAHEVWHVAFLHNVRRGDRDPRFWNYAGDYVINSLIREQGMKLPEPHLYDPKYSNLTTEQVFDLIWDEQKQNGRDRHEQFDGIGEDIQEGDGVGGPTKQEVETAVKQMLVKAATQAKMENQAGSIPGEINRAINDLINPRLSWDQLLEKYIDSHMKSDYSLRRPNRRYMPDHYMPSLYSDNISHLVWAMDTSGSIDDATIAASKSEIKNLFNIFNPEKLTVIDCDYVIHNVVEITSEEDVDDLDFAGYGGTSFIPVLDWCQENEANVLVYFTDMYAERITEEYGYTTPTIWVSYSDHDPMPWGETVYYGEIKPRN